MHQRKQNRKGRERRKEGEGEGSAIKILSVNLKSCTKLKEAEDPADIVRIFFKCTDLPRVLDGGGRRKGGKDAGEGA